MPYFGPKAGGKWVLGRRRSVLAPRFYAKFFGDTFETDFDPVTDYYRSMRRIQQVPRDSEVRDSIRFIISYTSLVRAVFSRVRFLLLYCCFRWGLQSGFLAFRSECGGLRGFQLGFVAFVLLPASNHCYYTTILYSTTAC